MEEDAPFEYQISTGDAKSWFDAVRTCKVIDTIGTFNRLEVHVLYIPSILYQAPRGGLFISCTFEMDGLFTLVKRGAILLLKQQEEGANSPIGGLIAENQNLMSSKKGKKNLSLAAAARVIRFCA